MSWLGRIEEACAAFIEQTFARSFPTDVEPAQIARKLVSTMEARTVHAQDRATAPSRYDVRVNHGDFERLNAHREYLEQEWAALLTDMGNLVSIRFDGPVAVRLIEDPSIVPGAMEIEASLADDGVPEPAPKPKSKPAGYRLRMVKGLPLEATFDVAGAVTLGRNKGNAIVLTDPRVSRNHARIDVSDGEPLLTDLQSTNGTHLNGKRISGSVPLRPGDVVTVGNTELRFEERLR